RLDLDGAISEPGEAFDHRQLRRQQHRALTVAGEHRPARDHAVALARREDMHGGSLVAAQELEHRLPLELAVDVPQADVDRADADHRPAAAAAVREPAIEMPPGLLGRVEAAPDQ